MFVIAQFMTESVQYLPRILAALLILIVGTALSRALKGVVIKIFEDVRVSKAVEKTPVEHFLKNAELSTKIEEIVGSILYWMVMLVVLHTTVSVLGLSSLSLLLERILAYLPRIISAVVVLFFGVLLAGLVESLTKGALRSIDQKASRMLGKVAGYLVVMIAILVAISELGIARDFILVLFIGFVTMIALGGGLALGLGGQDLVKKLLNNWYKRLTSENK